MLETILLVLSISIDSFLASIAYSTSKIKIPLSSALIIDIISCSMLAISLFLGIAIKDFLPPFVAHILSFSILFIIGVYRLFESLLKSYIKNHAHESNILTVKLFDFKFVLQVYADEVKADFDKSKILTAKEASYLALALSLDSLAVGLGSSLISINYIQVIAFALIIGILALLFGSFIGSKIVEKTNYNFSWISGVMLIILAFLRSL